MLFRSLFLPSSWSSDRDPMVTTPSPIAVAIPQNLPKHTHMAILTQAATNLSRPAPLVCSEAMGSCARRRAWGLRSSRDPGADRGDEATDGSGGASFDPLGGARCEPSLDGVQPRAVGGGEVQREPRVAYQPPLN